MQHCMIHSDAMQRRHNAIVKRVKDLSQHKKFNVISENQKPVSSINLRPDLLITKGDRAVIIDVTIPFENTLSTLLSARQDKTLKYTPLAEALKNEYASVDIVPIVIGSLGSWDTQNDQFLNKMCSRSYLKLLKKLCVSDVIRWSRDIYAEHLTGTRQYPV